ncbi:hypothetical protein [Mesorhizobium sp. BE184]|uniref:hypothetical protein n=1 Tax=Mesorhizobium sp. BE184 TaxID=2817714 RepID=UPI002861A22F|nr:hypothetical protein [Mesorhizobium sp. BE184]MDR7034524.1 hypothetical protein [Mesorhizobium sp. BE184]
MSAVIPPVRPDAKLAELGRQFEAAKAAARKLDQARGPTFAAYESALAKSGLSEDRRDWSLDDVKLAGSIYRKTGYASASYAFNRVHAECIRLMKAIHRAKATTLEGFAVKIGAIAFDQADFDLGTPEPADVAEKMLYRLARDMAKAVKGGKRNG